MLQGHVGIIDIDDDLVQEAGETRPARRVPKESLREESLIHLFDAFIQNGHS